MRKFVPEGAKLIPPEGELKFTGEVYEVFQWPEPMFDGTTATFEMLRRPDTVKIVAVKDGKVVVTYQRQPRADWFYDFPGGKVDAEDADELVAAKREMMEETGMRFRDWKLAEAHQPFRKIDWIVYTFVASGFIDQGEQKLDSGEEIQVLELDWEEVLRLSKGKQTRYLEFPGMEQLRSVEDLLALPEIYRYD